MSMQTRLPPSLTKKPSEGKLMRREAEELAQGRARTHMVAVNPPLGSQFVAARLQSLTKCPRCADEADELYKKAQASAAPSAPASAGGKPLRGPGDGLIAFGATMHRYTLPG